MVSFSEEQKRIALLLLHEAKTAEELSNQLGIPYDILSKELKKMIKLNLIEKEGFPTKYKLKQEIVEAIKKRQELAESDTNKLRIHAFIEMQAVDKEFLEKKLRDIASAIEKEKEFVVYDIIVGKPIKAKEYYSSYIEIELSVSDFAALSKFILYYAPTSLEIIKPEKITLTAQELQDGLADIIDMLQRYALFIANRLTKEELERFYAKLTKGKI